MDYLQELYEWFGNFWESIVNLIQDTFYWTVNALIELFGTIFNWAIDLFPTYIPPSPILNTGYYPILSTLSWLFPVGFAIQLMGVITAAFVIYFTIGTVLRWLRVTR